MMTSHDWLQIYRLIPEEFESPDQRNSGMMMDKNFMLRLSFARRLMDTLLPGTVFAIESGYRTTEYNRKIGGVPLSAHTIGKAADIRCVDENVGAAIISALALAGFRRIGNGVQHRGFIHVDDDANKPYPAFWRYKSNKEHVA